MRNKNYELIRKKRTRVMRILKTSESLAELILLKRKYKKNKRYTYDIRPEVVRIGLPNLSS